LPKGHRPKRTRTLKREVTRCAIGKAIMIANSEVEDIQSEQQEDRGRGLGRAWVENARLRMTRIKLCDDYAHRNYCDCGVFNVLRIFTTIAIFTTV
jgi:hypothetical protein